MENQGMIYSKPMKPQRDHGGQLEKYELENPAKSIPSEREALIGAAGSASA